MAFKKNKNNKIFGKKLLGFSLIIVFIFAIFQTIVNYSMEITSYIMFPIQKKIYMFGNYIKDTNDAVIKYKQILDENKILKEEHAKYARAMEINRKLLNENIRLQKIFKMKETNQIELKIAKINFRKHSNLYDKFYIDLGADSGIAKNMIVLTENNVLLGRITRVYNNYSIVKMITAENSNISGLSNITNMLGIVKGSNEDDGSIYFEPNTFKNELKVGEKIYTSGISDIFPRGLYIGYISEIDSDKSNILRSIKIKNDVDVLNLSYVIILMPKDENKEEEKVDESN